MSGAALTARNERMSLLPLGRVECRKMVDTRSGVWLIVLSALAAVAAVAADVLTGNAGGLALDDGFADAMLAASVLLPIVPILLMTSEWSQRTALSTFALVPVRERVIGAKLLAVLALLLAVTAFSLVVGLLGTAIDRGSFAFDLDAAGRIVLYEIVAVLFGFGLAAILMSSAAAIVLNFVAPIIVAAIGAFSDSVNDAVSWVDPGAWGALTDATTSGDEWAKIATAVLAWVVVPIGLGIARLRRRDIS